jgi:hypothetical protein
MAAATIASQSIASVSAEPDNSRGKLPKQTPVTPATPGSNQSRQCSFSDSKKNQSPYGNTPRSAPARRIAIGLLVKPATNWNPAAVVIAAIVTMIRATMFGSF